MKKFVKCFAAWLLLFCTVLLSVGCSEKNMKNAENTVKTYFTAVSSFNLAAMETCLSDGTNKDFGIDTTVITKGYEQTDAYKKAVESMFKALCGTVEYTIGTSEQQKKDRVVVNITVRYADVNQEAVEQFTRQKVDEYLQDNPQLLQKTEIDRDNIGIEVMADAYKTFLQTQSKISNDISVTVVRVGNQWKILNGEENRELIDWLTDIFGTF